jgi:hypothetical protein
MPLPFKFKHLLNRAMPRIKTELLQEKMVVAKDVKNIDQMLLLPAGCELTGRHIGILQAWGVAEIDVESAGSVNSDPMLLLSPEKLAKLTEEVKATFWKADEADPVFAELFKLVLRRRAKRSPTN